MLRADDATELVVGRGVVATIAAVGDDVGKVGAGQRLGVGDELTVLGAMERGGERDLHAEFVGPMRIAVWPSVSFVTVMMADFILGLALCVAVPPFLGQH